MSRILIVAAAGAAGAALAFIAAQAQPAHGGSGHGPDRHGGMMMMMLHEHLASMDKNGDGFISRDEFLAHPTEMFDKLDANHDGRLSKDELAAMAAMHHGEHRVCKVQHDGDAAPREVPCDSVEGMAGMHDMPGGHMMMMHHMAEMMDTDHDGRISLAEAEAGLRHHFEQLDKNHDGYVSKDEMPGEGMMIEKHIETHD